MSLQTEGILSNQSSHPVPLPSQKFTSTIMQYKEQIQSMRDQLKCFEDKENRSNE